MSDTSRVQQMWNTYGTELEKLEAKNTQWYKHVTLVTSSLFGILISLKPKVDEENCSIIFFVLALTFLGLTLFSFLLKLFGQIHTERKAILKYHTDASAAIKKNEPIPNIMVVPHKIFNAFEYIGYFSFLISVLLLLTYAWFTYY